MKIKLTLGVSVLIIIAGGVGYYWQEHPAAPVITENQPAGFVRFTNAEMRVSFDIPTDWKQESEPESGLPSFGSPDYSFPHPEGLKGAYIAYNVFVPPDDYKDKLDQYLTLLKHAYNNSNDPNVWTEISLDGHPAFQRHSLRSPYGFEVVGRIDSRAIYITFQATKVYLGVFEQFLKSFKVN